MVSLPESLAATNTTGKSTKLTHLKHRFAICQHQGRWMLALLKKGATDLLAVEIGLESGDHRGSLEPGLARTGAVQWNSNGLPARFSTR